jgi:hypothetical protein
MKSYGYILADAGPADSVIKLPRLSWRVSLPAARGRDSYRWILPRLFKTESVALTSPSAKSNGIPDDRR